MQFIKKLQFKVTTDVKLHKGLKNTIKMAHDATSVVK